MLSGLDMVQRLRDLLDNLLPKGVHQIAKYGVEHAEYERQYRKLVKQETLKAQADGIPATLIRDIVRGTDCVADARFESDKADALYKAAQESVNINKLTAKILQEQMKQEWGNNSNG